MNNNIYAITKIEQKIFSFLLYDGKAVEIHCDETATESLLGNIYIGKIKNIAKNIAAAFVEIAPGSVCYLPLEEIKNPVYTKKGTSKLPQAGDELLVQVSREGIKTKFPSVTTNITLYGKYALLTMGNRNISVSAKLSQSEKERLFGAVKKMEADQGEKATDQVVNIFHEKKIENAVGLMTDKESNTNVEQKNKTATSICSDSNTEVRSYGWLIRTNAGSVQEKTLVEDMQRLKRQYDFLMQQAIHRTCFSCLHKTPAAYLSRLSNLYNSEEIQILTDNEVLHEEIKDYLNAYQPEDLAKLSFYKDELLPMKKLYSLEHQLELALSERVWLNSGGYLVIQPTEALTVIDVNTGKFEGGKKKEASFLRINLEAAKEIARQIRLRNLSGIIIVDFINMESAESRKQLMDRLDQLLKQDPVKTVLVDMTKLSLVEITRMKREKPLTESVR